jgi:hypothetical protein
VPSGRLPKSINFPYQSAAGCPLGVADWYGKEKFLEGLGTLWVPLQTSCASDRLGRLDKSYKQFQELPKCITKTNIGILALRC